MGILCNLIAFTLKNVKVSKDTRMKKAIVYFCDDGVKWSAADTNLGGSEKAVVQLSNEWTKIDYQCMVYANVEEKNVNGVMYLHYSKFSDQYDSIKNKYKLEILVLWRNSLCSSKIQSIIKKDHNNVKVVWDVHDNYISQQMFENMFFVDRIHFKSIAHLEMLEQCYASGQPIISGNQDLMSKVRFIQNGVEDIFFESAETMDGKSTVDVCYASCWSRGLYFILKYIWPAIKKAIPNATFHAIYTEWCPVRDENRNFVNMSDLLKQDGVIDYKRVGIKTVEEVKRKCMFHLFCYPTMAEIDCISVKESALVQCVPILPQCGALRDRAGIHFDFESERPKIIDFLIRHMSLTNEDAHTFLNKFKTKNESILSTYQQWKNIARQWLLDP